MLQLIMSLNKYLSKIDKLSKHEHAVLFSFIFSGLAIDCFQEKLNGGTIPFIVGDTIISGIFYSALTGLIIPSKFKPIFCFGLLSLTFVEIGRRLITGDRKPLILKTPLINLQMYSNRIISPMIKIVDSGISDTKLSDMTRITYINHPLNTDDVITLKVNKLDLENVFQVLSDYNNNHTNKGIPLIQRLLSLHPDETNIDKMKSLFIHGKYNGYLMLTTLENKDEKYIMNINID